MDVRMRAAVADTSLNVAQFCREQGISRQTFYKYRKRFAEGGVGGLADRSRRPHRSPGACPVAVEDLIVTWRKRLEEDGADAGPDSIAWQLERDRQMAAVSRLSGAAGAAGAGGAGGAGGAVVPHRSTIARILLRRGLVVPQPRKRPRSSMHRFTYPRPNDCWQSDWTQWHLADGTQVAIAASLDDHSRYLVAITVAVGDATTEQVWQTFTAGFAECGIPARSLTDNGLVYSGKHRGTEVTTERNLRALGVQPIASTPRHPQTCGKIERFWQTLKRWLEARPTAGDLDELTGLLQTFRTYYNHHRPHRALRRTRSATQPGQPGQPGQLKTKLAGINTPAAAFAATVKARPADRPLPAPVFIDHAIVQRNGNLTVGPYLVNVGTAWAAHHVQIVRDGEHLTVFAGTHLVRNLTADPTRTYQPAPHDRPRRRGHREPTHEPTHEPTR